jgi:integral membrane protein
MPPRTEAALRRYRVMSVVVGVMLLVLVLVAMPLQFGAHRPGLATVVAPLHGVLYIVYLVTAADLIRTARFTMGQIVAMVCAGFLPGLAFYVERRTTVRLRSSFETPVDAPPA